MPINMRYCRFENTLKALQECSNDLAMAEDDDPLKALSEDEQKAARRLFRLCRLIADDYYEEP